MTNNRSHKRGSASVIIIVIIIVFIVCSAGFIYWQNFLKNSGSKNQSTTGAVKTNSDIQQSVKHSAEIISLDSTYNRYLNYDLGIGITYSKTSVAYSECNGNTPKIISEPMKIITDSANSKIYLVASRFVTTDGHQISAGQYQGFDICSVHDTTVDAINSKQSGLARNDWITSIEFDYGTSSGTVADMNLFMSSAAPLSSTYFKVASINVADHNYSFVYTGDNSIVHDNPDMYKLIYNADKRIALFWVKPGVQQPWQDIDKNGKYFDINIPFADIIN